MLRNLFRLKKIFQENEAIKEVFGDQDINEFIDLNEHLKMKQTELDKLNINIEKNKSKHEKIMNEIEKSKMNMLVVEDALLMESFSLYHPKYDFMNSDIYKEKLNEIRKIQKELIKNKIACTGNQGWTVNGKKSEGKKMVNDMIKLLLRSFNNECDDCISKVKFNNVELAEKRIEKSFETINKLGKIMNIKISEKYKKLKYDELYLAHEYKLSKQDEKEEQKRLREQLREEAKLAKEIEAARKEIQKEQKHYKKAATDLQNQINDCKNESELVELKKKLDQVEENLCEIDKNLKNVDYREANKRAGYVYIISNIGSFGEGIYKIGMTRRLEPMDRIKELGDASVPFNFDVHALIFSDDAPTLENKLHKAFDKHKLNMVNTRREFFKVELKDIESIVKANHDKTIEFNEIADATQYRETEKMKLGIA